MSEPTTWPVKRAPIDETTLLPRGARRTKSIGRLAAALMIGALLALAVGSTAAGQASEPTVRDLLIEQWQAILPPNVLEIMLQSFAPEILDQPASILAGADDPSAQIDSLYELLAAAGGNVDTSGAACQAALGAAYSSLWTASFFEPWPFFVLDALAWEANLGLKFCAPVLRAPADTGLEPDSPEACQVTIRGHRTQERASKIFFVDSAARDADWGPLGTPITDHYNSGMATSIHSIARPGSVPYFSNDWDPFYFDGSPQSPPVFSDLVLRVGRNDVRWRAVTLADSLDLIYVPLPGIPAGWKAAGAKTAMRKAIQELFNAGIDISASLGRDIASDKFGDYLRDFPTDSAVFVNQTVDVYDRVAPVIETSQVDFSFEGTILGGASLRTRPYREALEGALTYSDNCDTSVELVAPPVELWPVGETTPVTWTVLDPGPNPASPRPDRRNASSVSQFVTVVDTLAPVIRPPDGVIVESGSPVVLALQPPQIFDFVDANPDIRHDAPAQFPPGTTPVTWTVTDASGNSATALQYVAVKAPGSNTAPTAESQSASAESFTETPLIVQADDVDLDSLHFRISSPPENGFFVAPLFPYFVGDLRQQGLQALPNGGCGRDPATLYEPEYVAIDDDERSYVLNAPVECMPFDPRSRISVLDRDGAFVVGRDLPESQSLYGLWIDHDARYIAYTHLEVLSGAETYNFVSKLDLDTLETQLQVRLPLNQRSQKNIFDEEGFLYSTTAEYDGEVVVYDLRDRAPEDGVILLDESDQVAVYPLTSAAPAADLEIDSQRNLYVSSINQIWKFSPILRVDDGSGSTGVLPGEKIGWMGGCKGGSACDLARGASRGYGCSDDSCERLIGGLDDATRPGQFAGLGGIALDPNDNLYVAGQLNNRVQRFTPEGYFAGQARTSCAENESCFVRSAFSRPRAVSVNSRRFHVLDRELDVLYMFDTSVVEPLRNPETQLVDRARLLYQSNSGFTGSDRFSFVAGDGLAESAPAEVRVDVSRGFHPPVALDSRYSFARWGRKDVEMKGFDPDFGFDTLTYTVVRPPRHGRLLLQQGAEIRYLNDIEFFGSDSFEFTVSDGMSTSQPATVTIEVLDGDVPPQITRPGGVLPAGLGYPLRVTAPIYDPNTGDTHLGVVYWGDGSVSASGDGQVDVVQGGQHGIISANHSYASVGSFALSVCAQDSSSPPGVGVTCPGVFADVMVEPMADLQVSILGENPPTPVGGELAYLVRVDHQAPDPAITPGLVAQDVTLEIVLPASLEIAALPAGSGCVESARDAEGSLVATCPLPPVAPGGLVELPVLLRPLEVAAEAWTARVSSSTPDPYGPDLAVRLARVVEGPPPGGTGSLLLGGRAYGGQRVTITIEGQSLSLFTIEGELGSDLVARLAEAIGQDTVLSNLGVTAQADGMRLVTNRPIESFLSEDPWLFEGVLVGFEDARISIDLDYLGQFEIGPASGTVVMSPSGRIAISPRALGVHEAVLAQAPEADPFLSLAFLQASNDAGHFEPAQGGSVGGSMGLEGVLELEMVGAPTVFERPLADVGTGATPVSEQTTGLEVLLSSDVWTTGDVLVQGYTSGQGYGPLETVSGLDARGDTPETGELRLVAPLYIVVNRDGATDEIVPGFAELSVRLVPEPSAGLSTAAGSITLALLRAARRRRRATG